MKRATIISTAAMLAMLTAIAAPSKKGEKASPAKNRDADRSAEFRNGTITKTTTATFKPERTAPVQTGEFQVDLVVITFPDCIQPQSVEAVRSALNSLDGSATIVDYYKEYSQGITWPVLEVYPTIYTAPHPTTATAANAPASCGKMRSSSCSRRGSLRRRARIRAMSTAAR